MHICATRGRWVKMIPYEVGFGGHQAPVSMCLWGMSLTSGRVCLWAWEDSWPQGRLHGAVVALEVNYSLWCLLPVMFIWPDHMCWYHVYLTHCRWEMCLNLKFVIFELPSRIDILNISCEMVFRRMVQDLADDQSTDNICSDNGLVP